VPRPPKIDPIRGHRGRGVVSLPSEGRAGTPPTWPLPAVDDAERAEREAETWVTLWTTPQAVMWERLGVGCVLTVARYVRMSVLCDARPDHAPLHAQMTALEDRLGLTPKAMRLLLWEVLPDEPAAPSSASARGSRGRPNLRVVG